jgi:signal transduction histidine kinase
MIQFEIILVLHDFSRNESCMPQAPVSFQNLLATGGFLDCDLPSIFRSIERLLKLTLKTESIAVVVRIGSDHHLYVESEDFILTRAECVAWDHWIELRRDFSNVVVDDSNVFPQFMKLKLKHLSSRWLFIPVFEDDGLIGGGIFVERNDTFFQEKHEIKIVEAISADLSQRIRIFQLLHIAMKKNFLFETLLQNVRDFVWMRNVFTGEILFLNEAFESIWNISRLELLNDWSILYRGVNNFDNVVQESTNVLERWFQISSGNSLKWIYERRIFLFRNGQHHEIEIGVASDLTEMKDKEKSVERSERLALIEQIAGGVAHEISNPLTVVLLKTQMLQSEFQGSAPDSLKEKWIESTNKIYRAGERIKKIVSGVKLLSFDSRQSDMRQLRLKNLINEVVELAVMQHKSYELALSIELPQVEDAVMGHTIELTHALYTVITNSMESASLSQVKSLRVSLSQDRDMLQMDILDSGSGFSGKKFGDADYPIFRSGDGRLGQGFSLTVAKAVFSRHGGSLRLCESAFGGHIRIRLPKANYEGLTS